jgi:hypothetical protein
LGKFWRASDGKMLICLMAILNILRTFGIFYDHLVHFLFCWYIFSGFGIMYQEKSGNPDWNRRPRFTCSPNCWPRFTCSPNLFGSIGSDSFYWESACDKRT